MTYSGFFGFFIHLDYACISGQYQHWLISYCSLIISFLVHRVSDFYPLSLSRITLAMRTFAWVHHSFFSWLFSRTRAISQVCRLLFLVRLASMRRDHLRCRSYHIWGQLFEGREANSSWHSVFIRAMKYFFKDFLPLGSIPSFSFLIVY